MKHSHENENGCMSKRSQTYRFVFKVYSCCVGHQRLRWNPRDTEATRQSTPSSLACLKATASGGRVRQCDGFIRKPHLPATEGRGGYKGNCPACLCRVFPGFICVFLTVSPPTLQTLDTRIVPDSYGGLGLLALPIRALREQEFERVSESIQDCS